jgi:hypothetical protein
LLVSCSCPNSTWPAPAEPQWPPLTQSWKRERHRAVRPETRSGPFGPASHATSDLVLARLDRWCRVHLENYPIDAGSARNIAINTRLLSGLERATLRSSERWIRVLVTHRPVEPNRCPRTLSGDVARGDPRTGRWDTSAPMGYSRGFGFQRGLMVASRSQLGLPA